MVVNHRLYSKILSKDKKVRIKKENRKSSLKLSKRVKSNRIQILTGKIKMKQS